MLRPVRLVRAGRSGRVPGAVAGAGLLLGLALAVLGTVPTVPGAAAAAEPWENVIDGLWGDYVADVILTGNPPQSGRSMLLLPRGRGLYMVEGDGSAWRPVYANPERPYAAVLAATTGGDDPDGRLVYAGFQGRSRLARSQNGGWSWQVLPGPTVLNQIDRLASSAPSGHLYAAQADRRGLWLSTDHGDTWASHTTPVAGGFVDALFVAPDDPTVYLRQDGVLFRTNNDPAAWIKVLSPTPTPPVTVALTVDFAAVGPRGRLYAVGRAAGGYLVRASVDRGSTWQTEGWPPEAGDAVPVALGAGEIRPTLGGVWLGLDDGRVFESQDGARTWTLLADLPMRATRIVVDSATFEVWVGSGGLGLFRVKPAPLVHTGAVAVDVLAVEATSTVSGTVALLLGEVLPKRRDPFGVPLPALRALYTSTHGLAWTRALMTDVLGSDLVASPDYTTTRRLFSGQLVSTDAGETWRRFGETPGGAVPYIASAGPMSGTHPVLYGLAEPYSEVGGGAGLVLSLDGGSTWEASDTMQERIVSVVASPDFPRDRTAFFVTDRGQVYQTTDGLTFGAIGRVPSAAPIEPTVKHVVISPEFPRDSTLVAIVDDPVDAQHAKVYVSNTAGKSWELRATGLARDFHPRRIALSPEFRTDRLIFLGGERDDAEHVPVLLASDSAGAEWFEEGFLPPSIVHDFAWNGTTAGGWVAAAAGTAGLWLRDLTLPVVGVPRTATPTITTTPRLGTATATTAPTLTPGGRTATPTRTPVVTVSPTLPQTKTATATPTVSPGDTATPTGEPEPGATTAVPSVTPTPTATPVPSDTQTPADTPTPWPSVRPTDAAPGGRVILPLVMRG